MLLAQDGKLKFSDPVSDYVPDAPDGENITIAELLKMRSGLFNYTGAPDLSGTLDSDPGKAWTPQEVLAIAFQRPPNFAPDTSYEYSNTNYALLGLVAEKVGGRMPCWRNSSRTGCSVPSGLGETSLPVIDDTVDPGFRSRMATCTAETIYALADDPYPAEDASRYPRRNSPSRSTTPTRTRRTPPLPGGVISTANDMATWIDALVSGTVFNGDYHQQWLTSLQAEDPDASRLAAVRIRDLVSTVQPDGRHVLPRR